ncbi:MAG: hypothetical protein AAGJ86_07795 [Pseudomonadota bacterium]
MSEKKEARKDEWMRVVLEQAQQNLSQTRERRVAQSTTAHKDKKDA